ncbi:MAG: exo-alpha-sialidase, partial [Anaerohalosphaera sp.]|nr:exo-alpha-sialidase [Anaerohalosphaera sp.]
MYLDYNAVDGQTYDDLLLDGVHPNAAGHRIVADAIFDKLGIEVPSFEEQDIFISGQGGVAQYRIPSMVVTNSGTILAACDARVERGGDAPNNIDLHLRRSTDNGNTWTAIQTIADFPDQQAACDPSMVVDKTTGTIWCFYDYAIPDPDSYKGRQMYTHVIKSVDDGVTWSNPIDLTDTLKDPAWISVQIGPGNGIQTRDGDLIVPCYCLTSSSSRTCNLIRSTDHGQTWTLSNPAPGSGSENQAVELNDDSIMINIRQGGSRGITTTPNKGQTWTARYNDTALIEPGCQASFIRYWSTLDGDEKDILLFSNPASTSSRVNMTVRISYDEGRTWPVSKVVYGGSSAYSSLTVLPDNTIACLYECGDTDLYEAIAFAKLSLKWLTDGKDSVTSVDNSLKKLRKEAGHRTR